MKIVMEDGSQAINHVIIPELELYVKSVMSTINKEMAILQKILMIAKFVRLATD